MMIEFRRDLFRLLINLAGVALTVVEYLTKQTKGFRRWWVKPHLKDNQRELYGAMRLFRYFKLEDHEEFYDFVGMTPDQFDELFGIVRHRLIKRSFRRSIDPELRLAAVLNFPRHGDTVKKTSWFFLVGRSTMYKMAPEVCSALYEGLRAKYLAFPNVDDWIAISEEFEKRWNFPHVLGALDGKHIRIKKPPHSGSVFFCYKKYPSIVLMALCDATKRFIWANVGEIGSANDSGIYNRSDLGRALEEGRIQLPLPANLPNTDLEFPYFIIGDAIFPLKPYLMKPYTKAENMAVPEKIFNYRLSRARLVVECAFGILVKRWKIFERAMDFDLHKIDMIVMSLICIHNYLITDELEVEENQRRYREDFEEDEDEDEDIGIYQDEEPDTAIQMREALKFYFVSQYGQVHWQWQKI